MKQYLHIITHSSFDRTVKTHIVEPELLTQYQIEKRILALCNTSIIHSIETHETLFLNKKELTPYPINKPVIEVSTDAIPDTVIEG